MSLYLIGLLFAGFLAWAIASVRRTSREFDQFFSSEAKRHCAEAGCHEWRAVPGSAQDRCGICGARQVRRWAA